MSDVRIKRVESQLRDEIATMILRGIIKDPRVNESLIITAVHVSRDTSTAKVYVSSYSEEELTEGVTGLNHAAGFIQSRIAKVLKTRYTPKLSFVDDHSIRDGTEIIKKMRDLEH
ncbi:MAG: 30S ribosome-binding factor RbfA [Spirochaetia bacterium]